MSSLQLNNDALVAPAVAGLIEFSGGLFVATPSGVLRGLLPTEQYYRLNADLVGSNVTTAQSGFGVGVTLAAGTVYEFETELVFTKSAGTNSHTFGIGFGGTATLNNLLYQSTFNSYNGTMPQSGGGALNLISNTASSQTVSAAITSATVSQFLIIKGTVSVNAGGTFIPQYTLSAAPGGAYSTTAGSFFKIKPIGVAGANTSIGAWA